MQNDLLGLKSVGDLAVRGSFQEGYDGQKFLIGE